MIKILQLKITTKDKPIILPDKGTTDNLESYRQSARDKYKDLITKHTSECLNPCVHLTYEHE